VGSRLVASIVTAACQRVAAMWAGIGLTVWFDVTRRDGIPLAAFRVRAPTLVLGSPVRCSFWALSVMLIRRCIIRLPIVEVDGWPPDSGCQKTAIDSSARSQAVAISAIEARDGPRHHSATANEYCPSSSTVARQSTPEHAMGRARVRFCTGVR
jgi:hypothetical protein